MKIFDLFEDYTIDKESRLQRAKQMGFDTSKVWYTGTPFGDIEEFDPTRTADENLAYGKGIYTTLDPDAASGYSRPGASWGNDTDDEPQSTVYPVYLAVQNPFDLEKIYNFNEVKRILSHCEYESELLTELEQDVEYTSSYSEQIGELEEELEMLEYKDWSEEIDPDDYEDGETDSDYQSELEYLKKFEENSLKKQIQRYKDLETKQYDDHQKAIQNNRYGSLIGKTIYKELWTNTYGYYDWKQEGRLFGGETDTIEFKTEANKILQELGYDGIIHVDKYNPGNKGVSHTVMIAFHPYQVRSIFAKFDPNKKQSGKITD